MLAVSHQSSSALPSIHFGVMDESGQTINPAALNATSKHSLTGRAAVRRALPA
jgi:hypothetical protein